jgi:hypothetical protein
MHLSIPGFGQGCLFGSFPEPEITSHLVDDFSAHSIYRFCQGRLLVERKAGEWPLTRGAYLDRAPMMLELATFSRI